MAKVNPIELQRRLKGIEHPASRQAILDRIEDDDEMRELLQGSPDEEYETPAAIDKAVGALE